MAEKESPGQTEKEYLENENECDRKQDSSVLQKEAYVRYKTERHRCLAEHHASNV